MSFDGWNRLVAVNSTTGTLIASYSYDGMGRMITSISAGTTTDTFFTGQQDIETRTGMNATSSGSVAANTIFSPVYTNAILARDAAGTKVYFTSDANFDVTAVVSSAGTVLQRQVYDAYGKVIFTDASWNTTTDGNGLTHLWQGGKRDAATGMYLFQARWYSVSLQQWVSTDPIQAGMNWYEPMAANPIKYTDPKGTDIWVSGKSPSDSVPFHQSICIGDPNGSFQRWEFDLDGSRFQVFNPFNDSGVVETNTDPGGAVVEIIHTTPAQDAEATQIMNGQVGMQWKILEQAGGDISVLGIKVNRNSPLENFDQLIKQNH